MTFRQTYLQDRPDWPNFRWDESAIAGQLAQVRARQSQLLQAMASLGFETRQDTLLKVLTQDVQKTSEIEGEKLEAAQVRSSIGRRLGMDVAGLPTASRNVEGVVEMMLDATQHYDKPLSVERLFAWHRSLFQTNTSKMVIGAWRTAESDPMQVVSGPIGYERIHFEAPTADRVPHEMAAFIDWFESNPLDPLLKAAISHLWFVTIHPFDDGNGRIGRAIMDLALTRWDGTSQRYYSLSAQIHKDRAEYYNVLERTSKASMDVTQWIQWFLLRLDDSLQAAEGVLEIVDFWKSHSEKELNARQRKVVNLLLQDFQGKLQTAKYAKIANCSPDTALRDLTDLVAKGILKRDDSGGRSTGYLLA